MWIGLIAGWILGSVTLYIYMVVTAQEPIRPECLDCELTDCAGCPYALDTTEAASMKRAA